MKKLVLVALGLFLLVSNSTLAAGLSKTAPPPPGINPAIQSTSNFICQIVFTYKTDRLSPKGCAYGSALLNLSKLGCQNEINKPAYLTALKASCTEAKGFCGTTKVYGSVGANYVIYSTNPDGTRSLTSQGSLPGGNITCP